MKKFILLFTLSLLIISGHASAEIIKFKARVSFNECSPGCEITGGELENVELESINGRSATWLKKMKYNGEELNAYVTVTPDNFFGYHFLIWADNGNLSRMEVFGDVLVHTPTFLNHIIFRGTKFEIGGKIFQPTIVIN